MKSPERMKNNMYILAIETTGPKCSAAVIDEHGQIAEISSEGTLNHLQDLTPMVAELLENCELNLADAKAVAVSQGPGSFTGIRIGVSTARAFCQACGLEAIAVPTLKAFAYHRDADCGIIAPMFDARREQVFAGAYIWQDGEIVEVVRGDAYALSDFLDAVKDAANAYNIKEAIFFGDGCNKYGDKAKAYCDEAGMNCEITGEVQRASSVVQLALDMYERGETVSYGQLKPDYMRKAEAERKLEEKQAQK